MATGEDLATSITSDGLRRKYVTLKCRIVRGHHETLDRLNGITAYLKALYKGV